MSNVEQPLGLGLGERLGPLPKPMGDYPEPGERTYTEAALIEFGRQERAAERERLKQAVYSRRVTPASQRDQAFNAGIDAAWAAIAGGPL